MVHLVPNSITAVSSFIHLYEAYMGIPPHFLLWQFLIHVKKIGKSTGVVGSVMFCLRPGRKSEFIDIDLVTSMNFPISGGY
jgi:hypothetical protein